MREKYVMVLNVVALGGGRSVPEVYLRRSALDDIAYPGEWHAPEFIYRHGERDRDVANRLEKEFGAPITDFSYVGKFTTDEQRGTIHSLIYVVELGGDPRLDDWHQWFPVDAMPANTVEFHRDPIIPMAVTAAHHKIRSR